MKKPTTAAAIGGQPVHPTNADTDIWGLTYREWLVARIAAAIVTGVYHRGTYLDIPERPIWVAREAIATADAVLAALAAECQSPTDEAVIDLDAVARGSDE